MKLAVIVHGGAKEIEPHKRDAHANGVRDACQSAWHVLAGGGTAADAVEQAVRVLEDDPTFNAGYGADLNADGEVQMDAAIMEGDDLKSGAVAFIQGVRHPITVARAVQETSEVLLAGDGAHKFALERKLETCSKDALITDEKVEQWKEAQKQGGAGGSNNTVGCVVVDQFGTIVAAASTGGTGNNSRGRVGDSPQVGCGLYAESEHGAAAMTGDGEEIARLVLAKYAVDRLGGSKHPDQVANETIAHLEARLNGEGGCILADKQGRIGWAHNSRDMAVAYQVSGMESPAVFLGKSEEIREERQKIV